MTNYLEGYVRARLTMAEIERDRQVIGPVTDRPDARTLERWLAGVVAEAKRTASPRRSTAARSRLSGV